MILLSVWFFMRRSNQYYNKNDMKPNQNRNIQIKRRSLLIEKVITNANFCDDDDDENENQLGKYNIINTYLFPSDFIVQHSTSRLIQCMLKLTTPPKLKWAMGDDGDGQSYKMKWFRKSIFGMKAVLSALCHAVGRRTNTRNPKTMHILSFVITYSTLNIWISWL